MTPRVPSKKQTLLQYLQRGVTMVHLDARRPGVVVPPQYAGEAQVTNFVCAMRFATISVSSGHPTNVRTSTSLAIEAQRSVEKAFQ